MRSTSILVPIDGSSQSLEALSYATAIFPDATVTLIHVIDPTYEWEDGPGPANQWQQRAHRVATDLLAESRATIDASVDDVETHIGWGEPFREILRFAAANPIDHIVLGRKGTTAARGLTLGGVAEAIMKRAPVPVTLTPTFSGAGPVPPGHVLIALDGSDIAYQALAFAADTFPFADYTALTICALDIDTTRDIDGTYLAEVYEEAEATAEEILSTAATYAEDRGFDLRTRYRCGTPRDAIVRAAAEEGADHVVVGHRGKSGVRRLLIGSVSAGVALRATVPVTVYR